MKKRTFFTLILLIIGSMISSQTALGMEPKKSKLSHKFGWKINLDEVFERSIQNDPNSKFMENAGLSDDVMLIIISFLNVKEKFLDFAPSCRDAQRLVYKFFRINILPIQIHRKTDIKSLIKKLESGFCDATKSWKGVSLYVRSSVLAKNITNIITASDYRVFRLYVSDPVKQNQGYREYWELMSDMKYHYFIDVDKKPEEKSQLLNAIAKCNPSLERLTLNDSICLTKTDFEIVSRITKLISFEYFICNNMPSYEGFKVLIESNKKLKILRIINDNEVDIDGLIFKGNNKTFNKFATSMANLTHLTIDLNNLTKDQIIILFKELKSLESLICSTNNYDIPIEKIKSLSKICGDKLKHLSIVSMDNDESKILKKFKNLEELEITLIFGNHLSALVNHVPKTVHRLQLNNLDGSDLDEIIKEISEELCLNEMLIFVDAIYHNCDKFLTQQQIKKINKLNNIKLLKLIIEIENTDKRSEELIKELKKSGVKFDYNIEKCTRYKTITIDIHPGGHKN